MTGIWAAAFGVIILTYSHSALADGINTNNALTPADGQLIVRSQFRATRFSLVGSDMEFTRYIAPVVVAYGLHERLAVIVALPLVARVGTAGGGTKLSDYGAGDGKLLAKARIFTRDAPGKTARVALLVGTSLPSYDSPFSSESFDPISGISVSLKSIDRNLDADATYRLSTASGVDDVVLYNIAFSQMLVQGQSLDESFWQLNAVVELNAKSTTGGQNVVNFSPGIQLALPELIIEASIQSPIIRDVGPGPQPRSGFAVGMRRLW